MGIFESGHMLQLSGTPNRLTSPLKPYFDMATLKSIDSIRSYTYYLASNLMPIAELSKENETDVTVLYPNTGK